MIFNIRINKYIYAGKISKDMILGDTIEIIVDEFNRIIVRNNLRYSIDSKENGEVSYEIVRADLSPEHAKQIIDIADKIKNSGFYSMDDFNTRPIPEKLNYYTVAISGENFAVQTNDINVSNILNIVRAEEVKAKAREMYNKLII
jgi:hypothetical protein